VSLDDVKHVEAYAIIKRLVERPDLEGRDAGLQWLEENHPEQSAYVAAARSLSGGVAPELEAVADEWPYPDEDPPDPL
jgi:hypothetical protein